MIKIISVFQVKPLAFSLVGLGVIITFRSHLHYDFKYIMRTLVMQTNLDVLLELLLNIHLWAYSLSRNCWEALLLCSRMITRTLSGADAGVLCALLAHDDEIHQNSLHKMEARWSFSRLFVVTLEHSSTYFSQVKSWRNLQWDSHVNASWSDHHELLQSLATAGN